MSIEHQIKEASTFGLFPLLIDHLLRGGLASKLTIKREIIWRLKSISSPNFVNPHRMRLIFPRRALLNEILIARRQAL